MDAALAPLPHRERFFDLPLQAEVRGHSLRDGPFTEAGEVASLSADEAVIRIATPLASGTKLAILLRIPTSRWLEHPLEMSLSGIVRGNGPGPIGPERVRLVLIRLDRGYRIRPGTP